MTDDVYNAVDQFGGDNSTDAELLIILIKKERRTHSEEEQAKHLVSSLFEEAKSREPSGEEALNCLGQVAEVCAEIGAYQTATAFWSRLADMAEALGNRNFYYTAMDAMTRLTAATYNERHGGSDKVYA